MSGEPRCLGHIQNVVVAYSDLFDLATQLNPRLAVGQEETATDQLLVERNAELEHENSQLRQVLNRTADERNAELEHENSQLRQVLSRTADELANLELRCQ